MQLSPYLRRQGKHPAKKDFIGTHKDKNYYSLVGTDKLGWEKIKDTWHEAMTGETAPLCMTECETMDQVKEYNPFADYYGEY